jgi:hypothetical protein
MVDFATALKNLPGDDDKIHEAAARIAAALDTLDPASGVFLAGHVFAAVSVAAGLDDKKMLANMREHLALARETKRENSN